MGLGSDVVNIARERGATRDFEAEVMGDAYEGIERERCRRW